MHLLYSATITHLRQITAPLLMSSIVSTWCFIFIGAIRELSASILLTTANTKIVSVIIYDLNESGDLGATSVLGITLLVFSFAVVAVASRLPRRQAAAPGRAAADLASLEGLPGSELGASAGAGHGEGR